jgi:hypothetical protein
LASTATQYQPRFQLRDKESSDIPQPAAPPILLRRLTNQMSFPIEKLPKRFGVDEGGNRVLIGLSIEETFEFETLDDLAPLDDEGGHLGWRDGVPITSREKRWLELYRKHNEAWKTRAAKTLSR